MEEVAEDVTADVGESDGKDDEEDEDPAAAIDGVAETRQQNDVAEAEDQPDTAIQHDGGSLERAFGIIQADGQHGGGGEIDDG